MVAPFITDICTDRQYFKLVGFSVRNCLLAMLAIASMANSANAEPLPDADLIGRALGFDLSYTRECKEDSIINDSRMLIFVNSYVEALARFAISLDKVDENDFIYELISASVKPQSECVKAKKELDRYWLALEEVNISTKCLFQHLLDNDLPMPCIGER